jgi:hypothetical protein
MEIHPVGAELLHTDRQVDMRKLIVAYHDFMKAPKSYPNFILIVNFTINDSGNIKGGSEN